MVEMCRCNALRPIEIYCTFTYDTKLSNQKIECHSLNPNENLILIFMVSYYFIYPSLLVS